MAYNHEYPYVDPNRYNSDWELNKVKELEEKMKTFEALNKITFSGEWDITKQYPAWTVVTDSDNQLAYISVAPVPKGVVLTNPDYWRLIGAYDAQIEALQSEIDTIQRNEFSRTVEDFGAVGDGVTDDTQAFIDAFDYGRDNRCTITTKSKDYLITDDITIESMLFDGNAANLITTKKITLNGYGQAKNFTVTGGNFVLKNGHNLLENIRLIDFDGVGIDLDATDFESFIKNIRFQTTLKTTTTGLRFGGSDSCAMSVYGYAPFNGIVFDGGNNYVYDVHLWVRNPEFDGSTFCRYSANNNHLFGCFCDTYQYALVPEANALSLEVYGLTWFANSQQITNKNCYFVPATYANNRISGDVVINLSGFAAAGNVLDMGSFGFMGVKYLNVGNVSALTKRTDLYYSDIADLLGIGTYTGYGNIFYDDGFIKSNIILYFNKDRKTSLPYTDLRPRLILPQNLKRHKLIIAATYHDTVNSRNVEGYMILDFAVGTMTFTIPPEYSTYEINSICLDFVLNEK